MFIHSQHPLENSIPSTTFISSEQRGSALVIALFIIIILTFLGGVLIKIISSSNEALAQEVLGTRAYMAANSAMQAELQLLFPLNDATGICNATNPYEEFHTVLGVDVPGLYDCEAITTCDNYYPNPIDPLAVTQYYRLTSTGKCGSGDMNVDSKAIVISSRTIQVEARTR